MLSSFSRRRELLWQFAQREVQGRYRGSHLGMLWALITPLLTLLVYTFVFHGIFQARWNRPDENFMVYAVNMFSGIIAFNVFSESAVRAPLLIVQNANLVKKAVFPLEILPVSIALAALVHGLLALVILVVGAICGAGALHWTLVFVPVVFLPIVIFSVGVCWILSALGTFLRDTGNVVQVAVQLLFFATPVTYPLSKLGPTAKRIMLCNPLAMMVVNFRRCVTEGLEPDWVSYGASLLIAAAVTMAGYWWFMKLKRAFADVI